MYNEFHIMENYSHIALKMNCAACHLNSGVSRRVPCYLSLAFHVIVLDTKTAVVVSHLMLMSYRILSSFI